MNERQIVERASMPMALVEGASVTATSVAWAELLAGVAPECFDDAGAAAWGAIAVGAASEPVEVGLRGGARFVRLQSTPLPRPGAHLVVATDVTTLRTERDELADRVQFLEWQALSLSTFSKVMDHAKIVLFALDPAGRVTMSQGRGLEQIGCAPGERVGRDELASTRGTPTHEHVVRALAGNPVRALEQAAPGVFFDTWYLPVKSVDGAPDGVLGLAIDATERVRSEQQLADKARVIEEQAETIRGLGAPIITIWDEVLCMPIVGGIDAGGAADAMQELLERVVRERARFAIVDLTGVEVMDTATVQHVLRIVAASRTIGVEALISGVRPGVAQAVVTLGIELSGIQLTRTLRDALAWCQARLASTAGTRSLRDRLRAGRGAS